MEIADEALGVGEVFRRFPSSFGDRPAFPVNEVLELATACARIQNFFSLEFLVIVDDDGRRRVLHSAGDVVRVERLEEADMEHGMDPHGAWEFHEHLIPNNPRKPIRLWMEVGDRDLFNPNTMRDDMHDWVVANENMARVLAAKGYHYQFVFAKNAGHTDRAVKLQTLPEALEYVWQGYPKGPAAKP